MGLEFNLYSYNIPDIFYLVVHMLNIYKLFNFFLVSNFFRTSIALLQLQNFYEIFLYIAIYPLVGLNFCDINE